MAAVSLVIVLAMSDGQVIASPREPDSGTPTRAKGTSVLRVLAGHPGTVKSLAFAPDGKYLIAGGKDDRTVPVWDLTTGTVRCELPSGQGDVKGEKAPWHEGWVRAVAYSPDGKLIATGDGYTDSRKPDLQEIRLWDSKSGKLVRSIPAHRNGVFALAFSPDSTRILSGGGENTARVWDITSGKEVQRVVLDRRGDHVSAAAFSGDGKIVIVGSEEGELVVADAASGRVASRFSLMGTRVPPLFQVLASGKEFVRLEGGSAENEVSRYSLPGWKRDTLWRHPGAVRGGFWVSEWAASPDGTTLAVSGNWGVVLFSLVTGRQFGILSTGGRGHVSVLAFSPDGKTLAAGLETSTSILLWDVSRVRLETLWSELAIRNDAEARDCITDLTAVPNESVSYLSARLKHLAKVEDQVRRIAADLDDDKFEVREKASQQLKALGAGAQFGLECVLENNPSPEVRQRVESLLALPAPPPIDPKRLNKAEYALWLQGKWPPKAPEQPKPSEGRALKRAFAALEKIGTPEARQAIKALAETTPDSMVREQAKESLQRLSKSRPLGP